MKKPFVHLLRTINGHYVYDVNTNEIVPVSPEVYDTLERMEELGNDEEFDVTQYPQLKPLMDLGYLSDHRVKEIRHPASEQLEMYLDRKIGQVTLQVTQGCNLRCSYCIYSEVNTNDMQRSHSKQDMPMEVAKKAIDFYYEHSIDMDKASIGFYGGEPLLRFSFIKELMEYGKTLFEGKEIIFSITTNGTLLTDEIIDFFAENNVNLLISLDGPEHIHDINRRFSDNGRGSFHVIRKNIEKIRERCPDYMEKVSLSMVMDPQNQYSEINTLFSENTIFSNSRLTATTIDDIYSIEKVSYSEEYIDENSYDMFLGYLKQFDLVPSIQVFSITEQSIMSTMNSVDRKLRKGKLQDVTAPGGPCIPGQRKILVDVNGDFFPCERVSENSKTMHIGHVDKGFDLEKCQDVLNIGAITQEDCKNCWAFIGCNICAKHADNGDTFEAERKRVFCGESKSSFEHLLYINILSREIGMYD